jgi:hypothetical protein
MLGEAPRLFLEGNPSAAMITIARSGFSRPARVGVALVDGKLWSSGIQRGVRTPRLRRDPRCSVFVFEQGGYAWGALETTVSILEGPDAPTQNLQLFRVMQNRPGGSLAWLGDDSTSLHSRPGWSRSNGSATNSTSTDTSATRPAPSVR